VANKEQEDKGSNEGSRSAYARLEGKAGENKRMVVVRKSRVKGSLIANKK